MRSEFENWFKTTEAYKLVEEMNYFKVDLFTFKEHRSQYQHSAVQIAYMTYQHQQSKVDELQKRVDAVKGLAQTLWEKSEEKHQQGKVWESKALGECADEILDVLEQALKGDGK